MLPFDIGKVCRTKIFTKKMYHFASFNHDKTKDYVKRNTGGRVYSLHEVTELG